MKNLHCSECGIIFTVPDSYERSLKNTHRTFWCPNGHAQHFPAESSEEKLRRERDILKQQEARLQDEINDERRYRESAERSASAYKGQVTKIKKRASAGVCPCCNRSFENLRRHMDSKHPDYTKLDVIEGGKQSA